MGGLRWTAILCLLGATLACGSVVGEGDDDTAGDSGTDGTGDAGADADADGDADATPPDDGGADDEGAVDDAGADDAAADDGTVVEVEAGGCGDGTVAYPEECDDGNAVDGDGCDTDCTYSCHSNTDCPDDGSVCTAELCDGVPGGRMCVREPAAGSCDDGDPCTVEDYCAEGTCRPGRTVPVWYRDADGDFYGDARDWICTFDPPYGYADNDRDCCDANASVHPEQMGWFVEPNGCGEATAAFDYNCDDWAESRYMHCVRCSMVDGTCTGTPGWMPSGDGCVIPSCGVMAPWADTCRLVIDPTGTDTCVPNPSGTGGTRQPCR